MVDDFVVDYAQGLKPGDFMTKEVQASKGRKGKREFLKDSKTREFMRELQEYFETKVEVPLIRHGKRQRIETLINEEALLLAKYLRSESTQWQPRTAARVLNRRFD